MNTVSRRWTVLRMLGLVAVVLAANLGVRAASAGATTIWVNDDKPAAGYPNGTSCDKPDFNQIQPAVTAAPAGATINVCPGTYTEQVAVPTGKNNLILRSTVTYAAIIKAPPSIALDLVNEQAIVRITTSQNVTVGGFTITGPGPGPCNSLRYGVRVDGGGSANIVFNHITEIRDEPFSGCQNGVAILVGRQFLSNTTGHANILYNVIDRYQKNGPTVDNAGSSAVIRYNRIVGIGPTVVIAQNGIQISRGATADVRNNQVLDNAYIIPPSATPFTAAGILLYQPGQTTAVANNQLNRNQDGVDVITSIGNQVSDNRIIGGLPPVNPALGAFTFGDGIFADTDTANNHIVSNFVRDSVQYDCEDDSVGPNNPPALVANFWVNDDGVTQNKPGLCRPSNHEDDDHHKHMEDPAEDVDD